MTPVTVHDDVIGADDLRPLPLFGGMGEDQLRALVGAGTTVRFAPGEELFTAGRPADAWWLLVDGGIDLVRHVGREETLLATMDVPGRWAGGFRAWDEHGVYLATARGCVAGRVFRVPAPALRDWATTWFPFGVHIIEGISRTARTFEAAARQRESLVALGTLAAGFAHEINNPAAAAARAVDELGAVCAAALTSVGWLASGSLTAAQFAALDELRRELQPDAPAVGPVLLADREDALADWLDRHGIDQTAETADVLAGAGADPAWCDRVAGATGGAALEPALRWVATTLSASGLLREARESTRRISDLVAAVKSYAQLDRASTQQTDVAEGLDSTVVMLAYRIPGTVTVVRDYDPAAPRIEAAAAELNQLWTNLVHNALDAMPDGGTLRLSTRADRGGVVVEVGDTGTGMSPETQQHAFDPFFTTKEVGEGTGLGLHMACRIVDGHHGDIAIELRPGETVIRVQLPPGGRRPHP
ncbi:sensor histidine kinase [Geodermatophilus sp. CPCC 205506]|uniref:sensor histidine kinase n=1 Tax=Geodermatophilus sp. CPCC 205506 TaxID=2936596 RepID=UPI003EEBB8F6